jgi:hypothetical protein
MLKLILKNPIRFVYALFLVCVSQALYLPAKWAGKFSDWYNRWDIETFGW